jgi:hypothetical protein
MIAPTVADLAADLARTGHAVFPVRTDKTPATPHGFKDAVANPEAARDLFRRCPAPLIGVATGETSGFDLLDLDARHGATAWWLENRHRIPATRTHRSRSGSLHLLFQHSPGVRNSESRIGPGVDTRGDGGFAIWWPAAGLPVLSDVPLAPWPAWLLEALQSRPLPRDPGPLRVPDDRALAGLVRIVATASDGQRNRLTYWAACRAGEGVATGILSEATAIALIAEAGKRAGLPPLEALRTAQSGVAAGRGGAAHAR